MCELCYWKKTISILRKLEFLCPWQLFGKWGCVPFWAHTETRRYHNGSSHCQSSKHITSLKGLHINMEQEAIHIYICASKFSLVPYNYESYLYNSSSRIVKHVFRPNCCCFGFELMWPFWLMHSASKWLNLEHWELYSNTCFLPLAIEIVSFWHLAYSIILDWGQNYGEYFQEMAFCCAI